MRGSKVLVFADRRVDRHQTSCRTWTEKPVHVDVVVGGTKQYVSAIVPIYYIWAMLDSPSHSFLRGAVTNFTGPEEGKPTMPTENALPVDDSLDAITDALLTASRLLVAISAHSIALVGREHHHSAVPDLGDPVQPGPDKPGDAGQPVRRQAVGDRPDGRSAGQRRPDRPHAAPDLTPRVAGGVDAARTQGGSAGHRAPAYRDCAHRRANAAGGPSRAGACAHRLYHRRR